MMNRNEPFTANKTGGEKKEKKERKKPTPLTEQEKIEKFGKNTYFNYKLKFKPLTETQKEFYNSILEKRITFGTGPAGTGKSWTCLATALKLLKENDLYKKILIIVPTVEAGNMNIGYLKGDKEDKILPYLEADLQTITDILEENGNDSESFLKKMMTDGIIKGDAISFMRGKTLKNTIVILSEAENFNKQELMLLLSRIHPTSKYIINGDNRQQDRKDIKKENNGLKHAVKTLKGKIDEIAFCHFTKNDIVRDPLIEKIIDEWYEGEYVEEEYN